MTPQRILSESEINTLELVLGGLLERWDPDDEGTELLDREQTPIARVAARGEVELLRPLGHRPFADRRVTAPAALSGDVTVITEDAPTDGWEQAADRAVVLLDDGDHERLSRNVLAARDAGVEVHILPVAGRTMHDEALTLLERAGARSVEVWETARASSGGLVIFFTGLSGSGKSTIARALAERLREEDSRVVSLLDGDEVRTMLSAGLGFSRQDRELNVQRIAWVAALVTKHGGIAICAPIAPYESMRVEARRMVEASGGRFLLVHISTPLEICEARDRKGLYAKARAGEIKSFTGIDDPYEVPVNADLVIDANEIAVSAAVEQILADVRGSSPRVEDGT